MGASGDRARRITHLPPLALFPNRRKIDSGSDMHRSTKSIAALVVALVLLGLTWALLAQAASPSVQSGGADEHTNLVWVSMLATSDANAPIPGVEPFFVGQVYRRAVGGFYRIAGHVRASDLPALASLPGVIHVSSSDPAPTPPVISGSARNDLPSPELATTNRQAPQTYRSWTQLRPRPRAGTKTIPRACARRGTHWASPAPA